MSPNSGIRVTVQNYIEVEHYRPKNLLLCRSNEFLLHNSSNHKKNNQGSTAAKFGYYRLGNNYSNLLPSCAACNKGSGNSSIVIGKNLVHGIKFGKRNYFPILFKNNRGINSDPRIGSTEVNDITSENSLLFNPYIDDPKRLFRYSKPELVEGIQLIKVHAGRGLTKKDRLKACISINLLGLNRIGLCKDRMSIYNQLLSLNRNISQDIINNVTGINRWAEHANTYINFFCKNSAGHIGLSQVMGTKIGALLKCKIEILFPAESNGIFSGGITLSLIISELRVFSARYYDINKRFESVEDLITFG